MILSLASVKLMREASTTMALTNLCELVTLQVIAFPPSPFLPSPNPCIVLTTRAIRTYLLITGCWDRKVGVEKCVRATRTIYVTLKFCPFKNAISVPNFHIKKKVHDRCSGHSFYKQ